MKKSIIILIVLALAIGAFALMKRDDTKPPNTSTTATTPPADEVTGAMITFTDEGFTPATLTVTSGTTVTVENNSAQELDFSSDPHPVHTDNDELNQDAILPGETLTIIVNEPGTWGYHNHLEPSKKGTIIVEAE